MTTIAIKNGIVAADTMVCRLEQLRTGLLSKIRKTEAGEVIGLLGNGVHTFPLAQWYEGGKTGDQPQGAMIVVKPSGDVEIYEDGGWQPGARHEFSAYGSGSELAIGAMAAGASAEQAVQIACAFDVYSGGNVETIDLGLAARSPEAPDDEDDDSEVIRRPINLAELAPAREAVAEKWRTDRGLG